MGIPPPSWTHWLPSPLQSGLLAQFLVQMPLSPEARLEKEVGSSASQVKPVGQFPAPVVQSEVQ
jgi:hypothetical protein